MQESVEDLLKLLFIFKIFEIYPTFIKHGKNINSEKLTAIVNIYI